MRQSELPNLMITVQGNMMIKVCGEKYMGKQREQHPVGRLWLGPKIFCRKKGCNRNWRQLEMPGADAPKGLLDEHLIVFRPDSTTRTRL